MPILTQLGTFAVTQNSLDITSLSGCSFPNLTTTQRDALVSPATGTMIFNTTKRDTQIYRNSVWENVGVPIGSIAPFGSDPSRSIPDGWLFCDGSVIARATYSDLFRVIGVSFGVGNGSTTFSLPDFRGTFLRGSALGTNNDPDRASRGQAVAGTFTLTGSTTNGSSTITVPSTVNLAPGMSVTGGATIPGSSVVLAVLSSTTFQLGNTSRASVNAAATNASITLTFSNSSTADFVGSIQTYQTRQHDHQTARNYINGAYQLGTGSQRYSGGAYDYTDENGVTYYADRFGSGGDMVTGFSGGNESRPINTTVGYIIKY